MSTQPEPRRGMRMSVVITLLVVGIVLVSAVLGYLSWSRYPG
jgi:flagellar basal body-associated protein FliL